MMKQDLNVMIGPGDQISYIITAGVKGSKVSNRAEEPAYVQVKNLLIDVDYYHKQIKRLLVNIFDPILDGDEKAKKMLFTGMHMNHVVKQKLALPPAFAGFVVTKRCVKCKSPMKDSVCNTC